MILLFLSLQHTAHNTEKKIEQKGLPNFQYLDSSDVMVKVILGIPNFNRCCPIYGGRI